MPGSETSSLHKHEVPELGKSKRGRRLFAFGEIWSLSALDAKPILMALSICAGTIFYLSMEIEPPFDAIVACFVLATGIYFFLQKYAHSAGMHLIALGVLGVTVGLLAGKVRTVTIKPNTVAAQTDPVMVEGWVTAVEPGRNGLRLRLSVHAIAGRSQTGNPRTIRLTHRSGLAVSPGRFVRCWSVLRPPPQPSLPNDYDFQRQAWFDELGAVGYVQGRCRGGTLGAPSSAMAALSLRISSFRRQLAAYVNESAGKRGGGFAAALISGDRSFMAMEDQDALRQSGLAHLLAISGLHMGIVGGLVFFLLKRGLAFIGPLAVRYPVQKLAAIGALVASVMYLVLSGASVSTQRAFIMSAVVFGAVLFDRAAISLRSFAFAMIAILLLQPESSLTPGFQMSFAASGALIATYEAWTRRRALSANRLGSFSYAWSSLAVTSVVAAVATAPFAIYHFDRVAAWGLIANLLSMPIITFVSAPAAALSILLTPLGGADVGLRAFGLSLEGVLAIAHWCAAMAPGGLSITKQMPDITLAFFAVAIAIAILAQGWWRLILAIPAIHAAGVFWWQAPSLLFHWSTSGDVFVRATSGEIQRIGFAEGSGLSPLKFSDLPSTKTCSDRDCTIETPLGVLVLSWRDGVPKVDCSGLATPNDPKHTCSTPYRWSDVQEAGAISLYTVKDGRVVTKSVSCGNRPWRPCL